MERQAIFILLFVQQVWIESLFYPNHEGEEEFMKKSLLVLFTVALGLPLVIGGFQPVFAQEKDTVKAEFTLEEIVVTAQKQEQQVQDVPIPMTVTTMEQMERQMIYTLQDLTRTTAGLEFGDPGGGPGGAAVIRGIGTAIFDTQSEPSVGVVLDGVPQGAVNIGNLLDVERIEVLRGPQGTLFGNSASAGIINIVTGAPEPGVFFGRVGADATFDDTLGSKFGRQEIRAMVNVPLAEYSALRMTASGNFIQGLRKNVTPGMDDQDTKNYDFRAKYLYAPTDEFSINLIADYAQRNTDGPNLFTMKDMSPSDPLYAHFTGPDCGITPGDQNQEVCTTFEMKDQQKRYGFSAQFDWAMANHSFVSISSYKHNNIGPYRQSIFGYDWTPGFLEIRRWGSERHTDTFTQEIRAHAPADQELDYLFGLYYQQQDEEPDALGFSNIKVPLPFNPGPVPPNVPPFNLEDGFDWDTANTTETITKSKNFALFADANYQISDAFTVLAGLRYSMYDLNVTNENILATDPEFGTFEEINNEENFLTWRAGLQYDANEDIMLYATYATSVKGPVVVAPQQTELSEGSRIIDAETPASFELGTKIAAFDKKLALDLNAFYTTVDDYQGQECEYDIDTGALICPPTNINEVESKGFEIDIFGQPIPGMKINASYVYNEVEYPSEYADQGLEGKQLMNAPKHKFTFSGEYGKEVIKNLYGFVGFDTTYKSEKRLNTELDPSSVYDACWVTGARIGISNIENTWSFTIFGRNLFEEPEPIAVYQFPPSTVVQIPTEYQFRQVGFSLNYNF